ncbi:MAG: four helix bundle protein [Candidatus Yanofskybacteria bacterium]|nr:four helix bundle protein [Candidatus Yanofskybacteria bacterium]
MPIIQKLIDAYKIWHIYRLQFSKELRHSLGIKIDSLFIVIIENIFTATYRQPGQKDGYLKRASTALDALKFFLRICWEFQALNDKKYIALSLKLNEIGRMLGGWQKKTITP